MKLLSRVKQALRKHDGTMTEAQARKISEAAWLEYCQNSQKPNFRSNDSIPPRDFQKKGPRRGLDDAASQSNQRVRIGRRIN